MYIKHYNSARKTINGHTYTKLVLDGLSQGIGYKISNSQYYLKVTEKEEIFTITISHLDYAKLQAEGMVGQYEKCKGNCRTTE